MKPQSLISFGIRPALSMLPDRMTSDAALAMLIAIALQESRIKYRRQIRGPARGYWQFEAGGGVRGVLSHHASENHAEHVCALLDYDPDVAAVHTAIEHNDILAATFARLLLWTLPQALPEPDEPQTAWDQYIDAWRPGKPHRETWDEIYAEAWTIIGGNP